MSEFVFDNLEKLLTQSAIIYLNLKAQRDTEEVSYIGQINFNAVMRAEFNTDTIKDLAERIKQSSDSFEKYMLLIPYEPKEFVMDTR